jgi:flagellar hook-length control protein FliK
VSISASDPSVVSSHRPVSAFRSPSPADASDGHEASSPFAMLLDATAPSASDPPAPPRSERADARSDRRDDAPPADDRRTDAEPPVRDAKDSKARDTKDGKDADKVDDAKPEANDAAGATTEADALADAILIADATPDAPVAAPVAVAQPAAPAEAKAALAAETAEIAPLAAGPEAPNADAKDPQAKDDVAATTKPQHAAHADSGPIKPAAETDGSQGKGEHAASHGRHAAEERAPSASVEPAVRADAAAAVKTSAEAMQHLSLPTQPIQAATPASAAAAAAPAAAAVPLAGLAVEIASQAHAGKNRFEIRLDPPELGRIDVRLDVDRDGNVSSRLVVERADTLDLLRRDASQLERALQQAGLKTGDNALEFSLRDQSLARDNGAQDGTRTVLADEDTVPLEALRQGYGRLLGLGGGIDIRV